MFRNEVQPLIKSLTPLPENHSLCGWYRRNEIEGVNLNFVVPHMGWVDELQYLPFNVEFIGKIPYSSGLRFLSEGVHLNFYSASDDYWGAMELSLTGNLIFTTMIRGKAKKKGFKLNNYGLWWDGERVAGRTEYQIFYALDLDFVPPEKRNFVYHSKFTENESSVIRGIA